MIRWFAALPLPFVVGHFLLAELVLSAIEAGGLISFGHEALLLAVVPIAGWAVARWSVDRK